MSFQNVSAGLLPNGILPNENTAPEGDMWLEVPEGDAEGTRVYKIQLELIDRDEGVVLYVMIPQVYELLDDANMIAKRIVRAYPSTDPYRPRLVGMHLLDNGASEANFECNGNFLKICSGYNRHPDADGPMVWWTVSERDEQGDWKDLYGVEVVHAFWNSGEG